MGGGNGPGEDPALLDVALADPETRANVFTKLIA